MWVKENDSYIPSWISEGNKQAHIYIRRLYNEGLLDPEFFSNTDNDKLENFYNSRAGIMMHGSYPQVKRELLAHNPRAAVGVFGPIE